MKNHILSLSIFVVAFSLLWFSYFNAKAQDVFYIAPDIFKSQVCAAGNCYPAEDIVEDSGCVDFTTSFEDKVLRRAHLCPNYTIFMLQ